MKPPASIAILGILSCPVAWSASCAPGTLAVYEALGSGGCTIGNNLLTSFATVPGTFGATELNPSSVSVTPSGDAADPQLMFSVDASAQAGQLFETIFTYQISGNPYLQSTSTLANSSETVDGAVTDIQNLCEGGSFGPDGVTGCPGAAGVLITADGIQNSDQTALGSPTLLSVTDDFTVDGGTAGTASGGTFDDQFVAQTTQTAPPAVPEPTATLPLGTFVLFVATMWRRRPTGKNERE